MAKTQTASGKSKRILIVEDERPLSHALELKLTHEGFETTIASTGTDGLEKALAGKFDLMLLDLILPGMDGFSVLEGLQGKVKTPVIVLSNLGQDSDHKRAADLGAVDYLVKSNSPLSQIVSLVKSVLSR